LLDLQNLTKLASKALHGKELTLLLVLLHISEFFW